MEVYLRVCWNRVVNNYFELLKGQTTSSNIGENEHLNLFLLQLLDGLA
jgi:hypothetical protein